MEPAESPLRNRRWPRRLRRAAASAVAGVGAFAAAVKLAAVATFAGLATLAAVTTLALAVEAASGDALTFRDAQERETTLGLEALRAACDEVDVPVDDPYHERRVRYRALPLRCVLDRGFAASGGAEGLRGRELLLRARDGYTRPTTGATLLEPGGYVAFGESARMEQGASESRFGPIDRRRVDPSPFYLVWVGVERGDPHETPWPYQLARIEVAPFAQAFPATVPTGLPKDEPGWRGYTVFQDACASCHAINGQGGRVGPELNVPRSIVEYRPVEQIKAYVRNPQATRYTSMPPHPNLSDADLDALIAYFRAMSARKQDPRGVAGAHDTGADEGGDR